MSGHFFVTYSASDAGDPYLLEVVGRLTDAGLSVHAHQETHAHVVTAATRQLLDACAVLVAVVTEATVASERIRLEVEYAREQGKPLFVLWASGGLPPWLIDVEVESLSGRRLPTAQTVERLRALTGAAASAPSPAPSGPSQPHLAGPRGHGPDIAGPPGQGPGPSPGHGPGPSPGHGPGPSPGHGPGPSPGHGPGPSPGHGPGPSPGHGPGRSHGHGPGSGPGGLIHGPGGPHHRPGPDHRPGLDHGPGVHDDRVHDVHGPAGPGRDHPASAGDHPASARDHPASAGDHPASARDHPASAGDHPASARGHPASARDHPASARGSLGSAPSETGPGSGHPGQDAAPPHPVRSTPARPSRRARRRVVLFVGVVAAAVALAVLSALVSYTLARAGGPATPRPW